LDPELIQEDPSQKNASFMNRTWLLLSWTHKKSFFKKCLSIQNCYI